MSSDNSLDFDWVHLAYDESAAFTETYGFAGNQGAVNLEGILIRPHGVPSRTLYVMMHPASTLQLLPVPRAMAAAGAHVLCAGSRYARNDTACVLEKVLLDLGAYISHAKNVWEYEQIVLLGWSGGGSLALFYQSQAEHPSITHTPAGDPVDITSAGLMPADAVVFQAAHISRARMLSEMIDPSVRNELDPDDRDPELDIYAPGNPNRPPYPAEFVSRYRAAQLDRVRRITAGVKQQLNQLRQLGTGEVERGFVTHRTLADPRFLDATLDPNGRRPDWCYLGKPETVNNGPVGLARFSTLRAWLSQWSIDDTNADGLRSASRISVPFLAIENSADDAVPEPHIRSVFEAAASRDKQFVTIEGATHYYAGQAGKLEEVTRISMDWAREQANRGRQGPRG
ncbi:alpha/beta hydrolase [Amycolatopsis pithecellobii]|uniref:Alpha/beta hydrolase n=1 Tax=Amycolatopsis pithecellobii TaxID=664692 RepID=A0A6N7Z586_9PSEU|nr:alpha/beta hydrolase [Amycolatopsis pithecellobii]MTD54566.1 alpha/beta hydrolase [Amycolatopsis pithecellobii]